ncbi:MAG: FAD-dependent oxidoreductase [Clostridia bacterium]|nr:FAD-dependent oxidoreductase [Oscillospiraceae bacterium]MBQ2746272.1 FAD-dependent oxidoreductase [Clostridia bacterium]
MYDIVIVGAGPAGLTAAIYARRANKSVLILEKNGFGGQITSSPKVENYPGFESVSGSELADSITSQVLAQGADVEIETVTEIKDNGKTKTVITEEGNEYECLSVIIAGGAKHRHLGLENEEKFIGEGISFCAVCDGAFYANKTVALIGGGNSALQEAILLCETCKKVYVVQNLDFLTGEERLQEILRSRGNAEIITGAVVSKIPDGDALSSIVIKKTATGEETTLQIDGMFVAIGLEPENESFSNVADLDKFGYIDTDETCATKTAGVFVAGDCRKKAVRQVATAVADGAVAAISACRYIDAL